MLYTTLFPNTKVPKVRRTAQSATTALTLAQSNLLLVNVRWSQAIARRVKGERREEEEEEKVEIIILHSFIPKGVIQMEHIEKEQLKKVL